MKIVGMGECGKHEKDEWGLSKMDSSRGSAHAEIEKKMKYRKKKSWKMGGRRQTVESTGRAMVHATYFDNEREFELLGNNQI